MKRTRSLIVLISTDFLASAPQIMKIHFWKILVFGCSLYGCQSKDESNVGVSKKDGNGSERFEEFYQRFHNDSLYQISRIQFPLPGINSDEMSVEDSVYFWKKEGWLMHHPVDTTLFHRKATMLEGVVEEEITSDDPGVYLKRTFRVIGGKWYLVLFEDVNL